MIIVMHSPVFSLQPLIHHMSADTHLPQSLIPLCRAKILSWQDVGLPPSGQVMGIRGRRLLLSAESQSPSKVRAQ
jgi:hypothetical protein